SHINLNIACDMASLPYCQPCYHYVINPIAREKFESAYGVTIDENPGLNNIQMLCSIEERKMKAMYLVGESMSLVDSDANHVDKVLSELEFFVIQDIFFSRTAQYADVILPAAPSLEKEGTFTNTERRVQRLYQALPNLGDSKPDWWI